MSKEEDLVIINNKSTSISGTPSPSPSTTNIKDGSVGDLVPVAAVPEDQSLLALAIPILLCITTSFSGFIFGWDVGTIGGISNMGSFLHTFAPRRSSGEGHEFNSMIIGLIISVFNAGCAIGGLTISKLADFKGRKFGIAISVFVYIIGTLVQITSGIHGSWVQFMLGRIITGLAVGSTSVITPMFISESAPVRIRGAMVVFYQLMITLGILLGNITNYGCRVQFAGSIAEWMTPVGLSFVWGGLILLGLWFMPESPVYLIDHQDDREGAIESIAKLNKVAKDSEFVNKQVDDIIETSRRTKEEVGDDVKWYEFLTGKPKLFKRLIIGMAIMFFQQFSGANYFFYYGTSLFNSVGIEDSYITAIILGLVNFISTFGGVYFVEKFGRKFCLLIGSLGMFTCMVIYSSLGSFNLLDSQGEEKISTGAVMIIFTCIYIFFFATTWGPVSFVVVSELYPVRVRATSMAIATSINWLSNFLISLFTPFITSVIGFKYGYVFTGCLFISGVFVAFCVPETKGLNIEQIDELYQKNIVDDEENSNNN